MSRPRYFRADGEIVVVADGVVVRTEMDGGRARGMARLPRRLQPALERFHMELTAARAERENVLARLREEMRAEHRARDKERAVREASDAAVTVAASDQGG